MIYLICFTISCLLIWLGENNRKYFIASKMIFLLALIIPAALAGLRDFSIGYDVTLYIKPFFDDVVSSPNLNAVSRTWDGWIEPGYRWLNFIVAQFTNDVHWFFFWIMFLQNIFTFLGLYTYRNKLPIWFGMLCYYGLFFNPSLCFAREGFAMSMMFFAFRYLLNKSYIKYALWALVGCFFHKSVISAFLFIPLHIYVSKFEKDSAKYILIVAIIIFIFALETISQIILDFLGLDHLYRALLYFGESNYIIDLKTFIVSTTLFVPPFIFFYWKRKKLYNLGKEYHFFFVITIICLLSTQLMFFGDYLSRMTSVFRWLLILILPISLLIYKDRSIKQLLLKAYFICYVFCYWLINIRRNGDETFPYYSPILSSIF